MLVAVDCILFGFDVKDHKLLLVQRALEPKALEWNLMGGFEQQNEDTDQAANRVLYQLTGLKDIYL